MAKIPHIFLFGVVACASGLHASLDFAETTLRFTADSTQGALTAHFGFTNRADRTITITKVDSSCGCTAVVPDKDVIAPGESGEIAATFTFGSRSGHQTKVIYVSTDEGRAARYQLNLEVEIRKVLTIEPKLLRWNSQAPLHSQRLTVRYLDPKANTFAGFEEGIEGFTITKLPSEQPGEVWLEITPSASEGKPLTKMKVFLTLADGQQINETAFLMIR